MKSHCIGAFAALVITLPQANAASAREYFVGGPLHIHDMEIVANYLVGVQMAPMRMPMPTGPDLIHLEADIHATADNHYGFGDGAWIPYLTVNYSVEKLGTAWRTAGSMKAMTAKDGPHYADNLKLAGPGRYRVVYRVASPETNGFYHHVDRLTGVPEWWKPFTCTFVFSYPKT